MADIGDRGRGPGTEHDVESPIDSGGPDAAKAFRHGEPMLFEFGSQLLRPDEESGIVSASGSEAKHDLTEDDDDQIRQPGAVDRVEQKKAARLQHPPDFADDGETVSEAIVAASVAHNWGLYQIAPDIASLEDVFLQLTQQEETA